MSLPKLDYARFGSDSVVELQDPGAADVLPGLSPDGRWLAYLSLASARNRRVFVRPFPDWTASRLQVSLTTPVYSPFWSRNRDELFYARQTDSMLVAASFRTRSGLEVASRTPLFKVAGDFIGSDLPMTVDATGQRFLLARRARSKAGEESRLYMVLNWASDVRARLRASH